MARQHSEFELAAPFASHMVLQCERPLRVFGFDRPGQIVRVVIESAVGETLARIEAKSSDDGKWLAVGEALPACGPCCVRVSGSREEVLTDVWLGEVWLAFGQSNMEWSVAQSSDPEETIESASDSLIRYLRVERVAARSPQDRAEVDWRVVTPDSVGAMTAVGYSFAQELRSKLGVAVGIIDAAWGGTLVEAWTSHEALASVMDADTALRRLAEDESNIESIKSEYEARLVAWEERSLPRDEENRGEKAGWAKPEADLSAWKPIRVPSIWQRQGLDFNGVVWFRTSFDLPEHWLGEDLELSLGRIDDFDHTYINGALVGSHPKGTPAAFDTARLYRVAAKNLHLGRNTLAVRVFDHFGEGGFLDAPRMLHLRLAGSPSERLPLSGSWLYRVEREIPLVAGSIFADFPATPSILRPQDRPSALYNGLVAPLTPLCLRGFLFYQGESNAEQHATYADRFIALIRDYRARFDQSEAPFYFAQLSSFTASLDWAFLREAQEKALAEPGTGRVVTYDIGERYDIHPRNKREVGRRFALLALGRTYGYSELEDTGPEPARIDVDGGHVVITFHHALGMRTTDEKAPRGFETVGADGNLTTAEARIEGERVVLTVSTPVSEVRYAFTDWIEVNLVNGAHLPAAPFRWTKRATGDEWGPSS